MARSIDSISKQSKAKKADNPSEEARAPTAEQPVPAPEEKTAEPAPAVPEVAEPAPAEPAAATEPAPEPTPPVEPTPEPVPTPDPTPAAEPVPTPDPIPTPDNSIPTPTPDATDATPTGGPDSFETLFPEPSVVVSGPPTWLWWLLLVLGAAALGFLAFSLTRGHIDQWLSTSSATPTPSASQTVAPTATPSAAQSPTPAPTPSPSASPAGVVKANVTLRVLNGTKVAGAAADTKKTLEAAGFTVKSIGNAKTQNYTKTTIYYQTGRLAEATAVQAALGDATLTESSAQAAPDMVLVIYGK